MGMLLITCGLVLAGTATWSGYRNAREAIVTAANAGDPTRAAIDAARPLHARVGIRRVVRCVAAAIAWLVLALYGLYLAQAGMIVGGIT